MPKTAFITDPIYLRHNPDDRWHPENPGRLESISRYMERIDWQKGEPENIPPRSATDEEILYNHTEDHLQRVRLTENREHTMLDPDTSASKDSFKAAKKAAGALLTLADAIIAGEVDNGFAAIRPPGHHATPEASMGFCLFNNVAIAARYLQRRHGIKKVAIIDIDVHHGNGTQDSFYADPDVLYVSTHRYPFYPGTGAFSETGVGKGEGFTFNIPLPASMGDAEYVYLYATYVSEKIKWFEPEFIIVSAGYDAHKNDPLGGMRVSEQGFGAIIQSIIKAFGSHSRIMLALEGGYDYAGLAKSVAESVLVLKEETDYSKLIDDLVHAPKLPAFDSVDETLREQF